MLNITYFTFVMLEFYSSFAGLSFEAESPALIIIPGSAEGEHYHFKSVGVPS